MSKELPYFKFVISEWQNGDIADENYYTQGVFISLCAYYWSKDCNVSMEKVRRRFKGDTDIITELVDLKIIKEVDGDCVIEFLDEQRQSKEVQTIVNRMNGAKGGRPPKTEKKPNGLFFANRNESETITEMKANEKRNRNRNETNIEERKEEKSKVEKSKVDILSRKKLFASTLEPFVAMYGREMMNDFYKYWTEENKSGTKFKQETEKTWSLDLRLERWARNDFNKTGNGKSNSTSTTNQSNFKGPTMGQRLDEAKRRAKEKRLQQSGSVSNPADEFTSYEDAG